VGASKQLETVYDSMMCQRGGYVGAAGGGVDQEMSPSSGRIRVRLVSNTCTYTKHLIVDMQFTLFSDAAGVLPSIKKVSG
jgi:hypothetical protein